MIPFEEETTNGQVVALEFKVGEVGKSLAETKVRTVWKLLIDGLPYLIEFANSKLTGKKQIWVNKQIQHEQQVFRSSNFGYSWPVGQHMLAIVPDSPFHGWNFDLTIDGLPFRTYEVTNSPIRRGSLQAFDPPEQMPGVFPRPQQRPAQPDTGPPDHFIDVARASGQLSGPIGGQSGRQSGPYPASLLDLGASDRPVGGQSGRQSGPYPSSSGAGPYPGHNNPASSGDAFEDNVAKFCAVTQASPDRAVTFLRMVGDDVEAAISLFFETQMAESEGAQKQMQKQKQTQMAAQPQPGLQMQSQSQARTPQGVDAVPVNEGRMPTGVQTRASNPFGTMPAAQTPSELRSPSNNPFSQQAQSPSNNPFSSAVSVVDPQMRQWQIEEYEQTQGRSPHGRSGAQEPSNISDQVVAVEYKMGEVGKQIPEAKIKHVWKLLVEGERRDGQYFPYVIEFTSTKLNGKKKIVVNHQTQHEHQGFQSAFEHSWVMRQHRFELLPGTPFQGWNFVLRIDGVPFHKFARGPIQRGTLRAFDPPETLPEVPAQLQNQVAQPALQNQVAQPSRPAAQVAQPQKQVAQCMADPSTSTSNVIVGSLVVGTLVQPGDAAPAGGEGQAFVGKAVAVENSGWPAPSSSSWPTVGGGFPSEGSQPVSGPQNSDFAADWPSGNFPTTPAWPSNGGPGSAADWPGGSLSTTPAWPSNAGQGSAADWPSGSFSTTPAWPSNMGQGSADWPGGGGNASKDLINLESPESSQTIQPGSHPAQNPASQADWLSEFDYLQPEGRRPSRGTPWGGQASPNTHQLSDSSAPDARGSTITDPGGNDQNTTPVWYRTLNVRQDDQEVQRQVDADPGGSPWTGAGAQTPQSMWPQEASSGRNDMWPQEPRHPSKGNPYGAPYGEAKSPANVLAVDSSAPDARGSIIMDPGGSPWAASEAQSTWPQETPHTFGDSSMWPQEARRPSNESQQKNAPDFDSSASGAAQAGPLTMQPQEDPRVTELKQMGFSAEESQEAVKKAGDNLETAVDWILNQRSEGNKLDVRAESPDVDFDINSLEGLKGRKGIPVMVGFLMNPAPRSAGMILCRIKRDCSGFNKLFPKYSLETDGGKPLMTAKKQKNTTSSYTIILDNAGLVYGMIEAPLIGELRANAGGYNGFTAYGPGMSPKEMQDAAVSHRQALQVAREELLCVQYYSAHQAKHTGGNKSLTRKMTVAIPHVQPNGQRVICKPLNSEREGLQSLSRAGTLQSDSVRCFENKAPKWNPELQAYVLNFNKRVTQASVKSFQLISAEDPDTVLVQFGRVGKDAFTMDFRYPISPFQAFTLCLSSFDATGSADLYF